MNELTPEQRIEAYEYALKEIKTNISFCCCSLLAYWLNWRYPPHGYLMSDAHKLLPELLSKKPPNTPIDHRWWSYDTAGQASRIAALEQCIKECLLLINQPTGQ